MINFPIWTIVFTSPFPLIWILIQLFWKSFEKPSNCKVLSNIGKFCKLKALQTFYFRLCALLSIVSASLFSNALLFRHTLYFHRTSNIVSVLVIRKQKINLFLQMFLISDNLGNQFICYSKNTFNCFSLFVFLPSLHCFSNVRELFLKSKLDIIFFQSHTLFVEYFWYRFFKR